MAAQQFTVEDDRTKPPAPAPSGSSWMRGCLIGCLGVGVVLLVLGVIATIWVARNWRDWAADSMSVAIKQGVDQTDLPAEEKAQVKVEIDRGVNLFREGKISSEQGSRLVQEALNSPLMLALGASAAEKKYLDSSGLSDEEKAEGKVTLQRFLRGIIDKKIDQQTADQVLSHVSDKQPNGQPKFRDKVRDEELRAFFTDAKKAADDAKIPEQLPTFDPSDEIKRIIDQAMSGPAPAAVPPLEPAPPAEAPAPAEPSTQPEAEN
jgi:hypothetical protein